MTKFDLSERDQGEADGSMSFKRGLLGIVAGFGLVFVVGIIAGFSKATLVHGGPNVTDAAILAALGLIALAIGYGLWRLWLAGSNEPVAPRVESARAILIASLVLSTLLGVLLAMSGSQANNVFSNAPVSPFVAIVTIAFWLIAVPLVTWLWLKRVDEHEAGAYRDGAYVAAHTYLFLAPVWWMATRAGWVPAQDPMIVVLLVSLVWSGVWLVKRYT